MLFDRAAQKLKSLLTLQTKLAEAQTAIQASVQGAAGTLQAELRALHASQDSNREAIIAAMPGGAPDDLTYERLIVQTKPPAQAPGPLPLRSQICRQADFALDAYRYWCATLRETPHFNRKQWEYFFICQALHERDMLAPGKRGLGFGVGQEPLPAVFANRGCAVVATDQDEANAERGGWLQTGQHTTTRESALRPGTCDEAVFRERVSFRVADMNAIGPDLAGFDFCWSTCCFEHLGSLDHGIRFVESSMHTLKPGGIAVHTTEFNTSSDTDTFESEQLSLYRRTDIERLRQRLEAAGHGVEPLDCMPGRGFVDDYVDLPPYKRAPHLRLKVAGYDITSIGLIVRRGS